MQVLSAARLLAAWERASFQTARWRTLSLLFAARPDLPDDDVYRMTAGQRDQALLELRERVFGSRMALALACPACRERLDLEIDVKDLALPTGALPAEASEVDDSCEHSIDVEGYSVWFRVPNVGDLMSLADGAPENVGSRLLEACVTRAEREGAAVPARELPEIVLAALDAALRAADPGANSEIGVGCQACGHDFGAPFDIGTVLWSELDTWAKRTLFEVHSLAAAYGWREPDVLALTPRRRWYYMQLAGAGAG
jgi:hypothetical protein